MALYRDTVTRVTLAEIRLRFKPRVYASVRSVQLEHDGITANVELVRVADRTVPSGMRRFFRCPRCGRARANVLGAVPGVGWACAVCGGWRGRNRRVSGAGRPDRLDVGYTP